MKVLQITVNSIREGEEVVANLMVEQKKGETWNRTKVVTVTSGTPEATRQLVLEDNERLVIEGDTKKKVVYDREQNMSKIVDADPEVRASQEAAEFAQKEANTARERSENRTAEERKQEAIDRLPKTNLGNPLPPGAKAEGPAPTVQTEKPGALSAPSSTGAANPTPSGAGATPAPGAVAGRDAGQGSTDSKGNKS